MALPAEACPSELTAAGKDGRAMNASGAVFRGDVKWSEQAYERRVTFHGQERNHMTTQVHNFRFGDKKAATRADDLLDTFCYAIALALGGEEGFA